jgi:hypothetical protein
VFIKIDHLGVGINDPVPAEYVGSPPRVGDVLWCTFLENNQDTYLIFNTQHQANDDMSSGVVRFGGQTEAIGVTIKIDPTEYVGSNRASIMFGDNSVIMGTGGVGAPLGDWYVYDEDADLHNLYHTGHSEHVNGGLTIRATGLSNRYLQLVPAWVSGGSEWSAIFGDNANGSLVINRTIRSYSVLGYSDATYDLGSAGIQWSQIFLVNNPIVSSDQNYKTDIVDSNLGLDFVNALRPVSFKLTHTDGREGVRTHYGLIAQEVETVLGADASDTAIWTKETIEASPEVPADEYLPGLPAVEEHEKQGLRYDELISPLIKAIQELTARVAALEAG